MNETLSFDTVTSILDARRKGSPIDEITRIFEVDRDTVFSVINANRKEVPEESPPPPIMSVAPESRGPRGPYQKRKPKFKLSLFRQASTWVTPPVHPAAKLLPRMSDAEINELAADIKANGLVEPIIIWVDNKEAANGSEGPFPEWTLDGLGRLEALSRIDITDPREAPCAGMRKHDGIRKLHAMMPSASLGGPIKWVTDTDPELYVLSTNVRRRHLTSAQKREAIEAFIKIMPQASNLKIAKTLGVDDHTVAEVRSNENAQNSEIPKNEHSPIERAKAAVKENPSLSNRALSKLANVSDVTVGKARRELIANGEVKESDPGHAKNIKDDPATQQIRTDLAVLAVLVKKARGLAKAGKPLTNILERIRTLVANISTS